MPFHLLELKVFFLSIWGALGLESISSLVEEPSNFLVTKVLAEDTRLVFIFLMQLQTVRCRAVHGVCETLAEVGDRQEVGNLNNKANLMSKTFVKGSVGTIVGFHSESDEIH